MKKVYLRALWVICMVLAFSACEKEPFDDSPPKNDPNDTTNVNQPLKFCNGFTGLCDKRYNEVVYATTHNSFNYESGPVNYQMPNQQWPVPQQLADGIRGLMMDVYPYTGSEPDLQGQPMVFNDVNSYGQEPFLDVLKQVKQFLDDNPDEVITLLLECHVNSVIMKNAFTEADLMNYLHAQPMGEAWPTLRQMIKDDKRLVVFSECDAVAGMDWYHHIWDYAVETNNFNTQLTDFNCNFTRGNANNELFILNHYISDGTLGTGDPNTAKLANANPFLINRVLQCIDATGKVPNFLAIDFYDSGDVMETIEIINEVD